MATPPSDDTREMFRLLADGEWHNYAEIKASVAAKVPPGRALRKYQMRLRQNRELRKDPNTEIYRSEDDQIRLGQGACAQITMTSWIGKGIISKGEGPGKEVKIKPGFKPWGVETGPVSEPQDPPEKAEGYTEVPPSDSVPSEPSGAGAQEASVSEPEPRYGWAEPPSDEQRAADQAAHGEGTLPARRIKLEPESFERPISEPGPVPEPEPDLPGAQLLSDVIDPAVQEPSSPYVTNVPVWSCPECFMAVTNEAEHARWHRELKAGPSAEEFALVDREAMVTLIGDVTRQVLDEFQSGMQDWFETRFAELERQIFALRGVRPDRPSWTQKL